MLGYLKIYSLFCALVAGQRDCALVAASMAASTAVQHDCATRA